MKLGYLGLTDLCDKYIVYMRISKPGGYGGKWLSHAISFLRFNVFESVTAVM